MTRQAIYTSDHARLEQLLCEAHDEYGRKSVLLVGHGPTLAATPHTLLSNRRQTLSHGCRLAKIVTRLSKFNQDCRRCIRHACACAWHARAHMCTHAHTYPHTRAHTHACAHTNPHSHACICTARDATQTMVERWLWRQLAGRTCDASRYVVMAYTGAMPHGM